LGELVEDDQPGIVEQCQHQEESLLLTAAEAGERAPAQGARPSCSRSWSPLRPAGPRTAGSPRRRPAGRAGPSSAAGCRSAAATGPRPWRDRPEHPDLAGVDPAQTLEDLDGCGLPRSIGADQADDLPGMHVRVEVVDDHPSAVRLGEAADGDDRVSGGSDLGVRHASIRSRGSLAAHRPEVITRPLPPGRESSDASRPSTRGPGPRRCCPVEDPLL
jgi:hypothetical protein